MFEKVNFHCLTQFELAIATESNLFRPSLLHETSHYIDLDSVKKKKKRKCKFSFLYIYFDLCF